MSRPNRTEDFVIDRIDRGRGFAQTRAARELARAEGQDMIDAFLKPLDGMEEQRRHDVMRGLGDAYFSALSAELGTVEAATFMVSKARDALGPKGKAR